MSLNYRPPNPYFQSSSSSRNDGPIGLSSSLNNNKNAAPRGYVPGLGRGAAGFTTRSDIGPMAAASSSAAAASASTTPIESGGGVVGGVGGTSNSSSSAAIVTGGTNAISTSGAIVVPTSGTGSRSAELRAAKLQMKQMQQKAAAEAAAIIASSVVRTVGEAPKGYVPGLGRGAGVGVGGVGRDDGATAAPPGVAGGSAAAAAAVEGGGGTYDQFGGYTQDRLFHDTPYDDEDEEADRIYAAIDERMSSSSHGNKKRKRGRNGGDNDEEEDDVMGGSTTGGVGGGGRGGGGGEGVTIGDQFRDLKEKLADVTEEQWMALPDVGDYSLRYKQKRREDVFTPLTDSLLEARSQANADATAGSNTSTIAKNTGVVADSSSSGSGSGSGSGFKSVVTNMSGLAEARGTVLGMSLDRMSDSVSGQTVVDPKGYLTSLSNVKIATNAEVGDVNKARLLLKSVRDTNPKHGPGWIAAARVEEAAGKMIQCRKIIQEGCEICPENEDVWLEAARLHPNEIAKTILATAIKKIPNSVKIFLYACDLENNVENKKQILRKGLESIPTSIILWKNAIDLEDCDEDAKILLSVAVEHVPQSVEMWLALARLESYDNARKVLNRARRKLPGERAVWIAASKLEESQNHLSTVDSIIAKAVKSLQKHDAIVTRTQWITEAENAERAGAPITSGAIVKHTIGIGVDVEDRQRTWIEDAKSTLSRNAIATSRAILAHALASYPSKRGLWLQAVELERIHGSSNSLDEVLAAASERLPRCEIFWLVRAKECWISGDVNKARDILTQAFAANPESESVWLAAAKLEWETGEVERARVLLSRARESNGADTNRVYMKSALLERQCKHYKDALYLIKEGIKKYPKFAKFYMMGGQICSDDLNDIKGGREFYQSGLKHCPNSVVLWTLASRLEERAATTAAATTTSTSKDNNGANNDNKTNFINASRGSGGGGGAYTKARSILELARLKNPKNPTLWIQAIRLEIRANNTNMISTLLSRALQECPNSGLLLSENIKLSPRIEQKSKCTDAIKKCPDDPYVICAVALLFIHENKVDKARKWMERCIILNNDIGDFWGYYYTFEKMYGTLEQAQSIKERFIKIEPKHGELWCSIVKDMNNRSKSIGDCLELLANKIKKDQEEKRNIINNKRIR